MTVGTLLFGKPDLSQIMQADPSLSKWFLLVLIILKTVDGYRLVYERKCRFELHLIDPEVPERVLAEVNRSEDMIVKILVRVSSFKCNETNPLLWLLKWVHKLSSSIKD